MDVNMNFTKNTIGHRNTKIQKSFLMFYLVSGTLLSTIFFSDIKHNFIAFIFYLLYMIFTAFIVFKKKMELFSPEFSYIVYCYFAFAIQYFIIMQDKAFMFFVPSERNYGYGLYTINFTMNNESLIIAWAVFIMGYFSFVFGCKLSTKKIKVLKRNVTSHITNSSLLFLELTTLVITLLFYYVRIQFGLVVPGGRTATIPMAGIIYYGGTYLNLTLLYLCYIIALRKRKTSLYVFSLFNVLLYSTLQFLIGWKASAMLSAISLIMIHYYSDNLKINIKPRLKKLLKIASAMLIFSAIYLYQSVQFWRYYPGPKNLENFLALIQTAGVASLYENTLLIFKRFVGFNNLIPIISYFNELKLYGMSAVDFIQFRPIVYQEKFYTHEILGVSEAMPFTAAPSGIGSLFIIGGIIAVIVGMFLGGLLFKFIYNSTINNMNRDDSLLVFYVIFFVQVFFTSVFEGTLVKGLIKNMIPLVLVFIVTTNLVSILFVKKQKRIGGEL